MLKSSQQAPPNTILGSTMLREVEVLWREEIEVGKWSKLDILKLAKTNFIARSTRTNKCLTIRLIANFGINELAEKIMKKTRMHTTSAQTWSISGIEPGAVMTSQRIPQ